MGDWVLPNGWVVTTLGDVSEWGAGGTPSRGNADYFSGAIPWIKTGELGPKFLYDSEEKITIEAVKNSSAKIFPKDSIAVAMYGATIGKVSIFGLDASTNQACAVAAPSQVVRREFLYYFLMSEKRAFVKAGQGGAQPNISQGVIKGWPIALPPLQEQECIVSKMETLLPELDNGISTLQTAQAQLKVYRQALLKHAFEGRLTADWRAKNPDKLEPSEQLLARIQQARQTRYQQQMKDWQGAHAAWEADGKLGVKPAKPKAPTRVVALSADELSELPGLPVGWAWFRLRDCLSEGLCNGRSVKDRADGFPVLRLNALGRGKVDLSVSKRGDWDADQAQPYLVVGGDFLVSRGNGSKHLVGRGGFVSGELAGKVAFPDTMIRVRVTPEVVSRSFFAHCWDSLLVRRQIERDARTTAGIYKINQELLEAVHIPLPGLDEQRHIERLLDEKLSVLDQLEQTITDSLKQSEALRQSILKKAFSGQLVPQDPADEPASALLARIRAAREGRVAKPRGRASKAKV